MKPQSALRALIVLLSLLMCSPAQAEEPHVFTVATLLPLSGRPAEYGVAVKNAIELARKNHANLFAGIRFDYEDSLYDGKTTITAFQKFAAGADLIFIWGHGPAQAVAELAERSAKPTIVITRQKNVGDGKKYVIRFCTPHSEYAHALLKEVRARGYKRIAAVGTEIGFLKDTIQALSEGIEAPETFDLVDTFEPAETDFQATVTKLKTRQYDLLGLFIAENQVPLFVARMAGQGTKVSIFGTHSLGSKDAISALQSASEGTFFCGNHVDETFHRQYLSAYGNDIQLSWAANAYDFAILAAELFSGRNPSAGEIVDAFRGVSNKTGVSGSYSFLADKEHGTGFVFPVVIKTITGKGVEESPVN